MTVDVWGHLSQYPETRLAYHFSPRSRWNYATVATRDASVDYNHRDVLPNEVVIDLDAPTEEANFSTLKNLVKRLSILGVKYSVWSTGGKGYHCIPSNTKLPCRVAGRWSLMQMRSLPRLAGRDDVYLKSPRGDVRLISAREREQERGELLVQISVGGGRVWVSSQDHKHPVLRGGEIVNVRADEVVMTDRMLVDVDNYSESGAGTHSMGRLIGLFLADGHFQNTNNKNRVGFTFDKSETDYAEFLREYCSSTFGANVTVKECSNCLRVIVYSSAVKALLKEFCIGTVALDKDVNARAYGMSTQFRRGIVEGWLEGDGLHRQYQDGESISKGLVKSMMRLCSSIGILSRMTRFKMSGREGHHYRLHLTKEVPNAQLTGLAGVYALPIKRINRNYRKKTRLVDIEVDGDHTFTLADGRVTHNCHTFWNIGNAAEPKLLREKIHDYLVEGVEGVYDKQLLGRHLVRAEYGLYEKAYPKTVHKAPVNAENHFAVNEVPEAIWKSYREEVFKLMLRHIVPRKNVTQPGHMRPCMKYILSPEFKNHKDGGKRAMFIVASYYRALEDAALYELLGAFNRYNLREPYTTRQMEAVVKSVRSHPGRPVGCKFRHDLLLGLGKKDVVDECES